MYVTNPHDMTLAVKVALNLNTTNQPTEIIVGCQNIKILLQYKLQNYS